MREENHNEYQDEESVTSNYEVGLSETFDKFPVWIRWVAALPVSVIAYIVVYFISNLGWYWYVGESLANGYLGQAYGNFYLQ